MSGTDQAEATAVAPSEASNKVDTRSALPPMRQRHIRRLTPNPIPLFPAHSLSQGGARRTLITRGFIRNRKDGARLAWLSAYQPMEAFDLLFRRSTAFRVDVGRSPPSGRGSGHGQR
jgi:hypothetical protein